ncbi:MAG: glycosyltransferase family 2 protein, partial [Actinomycetota bacterium]|nr:glycosyltransferase family 2 protein [Actinomycetota bacterium]
MSSDRSQSVRSGFTSERAPPLLKPLLSVVIPAFNAERTLGAVLEALAADPEGPDEVIVVDDCSTDRTAEIAAARGARVVEGTSVGYAGGARNRGWDAAAGDVVVFLDADAVPLPGFGAGLR